MFPICVVDHLCEPVELLGDVQGVESALLAAARWMRRAGSPALDARNARGGLQVFDPTGWFPYSVMIWGAGLLDQGVVMGGSVGGVVISSPLEA